MYSTRPKRLQRPATQRSGVYNQKPFPGSKPSQALQEEDEYFALSSGELGIMNSAKKLLNEWKKLLEKINDNNH